MLAVVVKHTFICHDLMRPQSVLLCCALQESGERTVEETTVLLQLAQGMPKLRSPHVRVWPYQARDGENSTRTITTVHADGLDTSIETSIETNTSPHKPQGPPQPATSPMKPSNSASEIAEACSLKLVEPEKPTGASENPDSFHQMGGQFELVNVGSSSAKDEDLQKSRTKVGHVRSKRLYLLVACVLVVSLAIVAGIVGLLRRSTGTGSVSECASSSELSAVLSDAEVE